MSTSRQYAEVERLAFGGIVWESGALSLIIYARDFAQSARHVPPPAEGFAPVRYYLACHAIELALKAYLALRGLAVIDLVDAFGHRLTPALNKALAQGLLKVVPLSKPMLAEIRAASNFYNDKVFEYPALPLMIEGFRDRPDVVVLMDAADKLVASLYVPCLARANA